MAYIGKTPTVGNFVKLDAITASATASYTMQVDSVNFSPESVNHMLVSLNGVIQAPTTSYTISGSTITFASALTSSDSIDFIMVYGNVLDIGTPSDATVTNAKTNFVSTSSAAGLQIKGDNTTAGTLQLNCEQNSHGIKLRSPAHSAGASYTLTFPTTDGNADEFLQTNGSGTLTWAEAGGSYVHLGTTESTSNDTTISVSDKFSTTYDFYHWICQWKQTTSGSDTRFRFLTTGTTEDSTSAYVKTAGRHEINSGGTTNFLIDHSHYTQSYALLANSLPAQGAYFHTLELTFFNPMKGSPIDRTKVTGRQSYIRTDDVHRGGTQVIDFLTGNSSNTYAGFKIWPSSGYMTNYTWQLYGLKKG